MKWWVSLLLFTPLCLLAQENLVPNPSFEEYTECPVNNAWVNYGFVDAWKAPYGAVDYYHECGSNGYGVPMNKWGYAEAHDGMGYIGFSIYAFSLNEGRQYAQAKLTQPLIPGKKYHVEYHLTLKDSFQYAISNMGAYLSQEGIENESITEILSHEPQVKGVSGYFYSDKQNWEKISGTFYAEGGEKYITLGNFEPDSLTDTLFVGGATTGGQYYYAVASYYFDDVMVRLDTSTNVNELEKTNTILYPNPNDGKMYLEYIGLTANATFEMYDVTGRKVAEYQLQGEEGKISVYETHLESGIYLYRIASIAQVFETGKIIIQR